MPLEDLLAMYGYEGQRGSRPAVEDERQDTRSSSEEEILSNHDLTLDKDEIARDILKTSDDDDDKETTAHELLSSVSSSQTARLLRCKQPLFLFFYLRLEVLLLLRYKQAKAAIFPLCAVFLTLQVLSLLRYTVVTRFCFCLCYVQNFNFTFVQYCSLHR